MRFYCLIIVSALFFSCTVDNSEMPEYDQSAKTDSAKSSLIVKPEVEIQIGYSAETFQTPDMGYGYKIYENGKLFIHQPHIPAISGNKTFTSAEKAQTTADFVIYKLEKGISPPSVTKEELDSLGVL